MNLVVVQGRLTHPVELRETGQGTRVCNFSIAINEAWTDRDGSKKERVEFVPIVVWGKQAVTCAEHLGKGHGATVMGRMQTSTYEDKEGISRRKTEVIANRVIFGERPRLSEAGSERKTVDTFDDIPF